MSLSVFLQRASKAERSVFSFSTAVISRSLSASLVDKVGGKGRTKARFLRGLSEGVNRSLQIAITGLRIRFLPPEFFFFDLPVPVRADRQFGASALKTAELPVKKQK